MKYEKLLDLAEEKYGLTVKEKPLRYYDGLIRGKKVAIRKDLKTTRRKAEILSEEIGHAATSTGDITDYSCPNNWKQEVCARTVGYRLMISPDDLIEAYNAGCVNCFEISEFLEVSEDYLKEAIERFRQIYGVYQKHGNYVIVYEPCLGVIKFQEQTREE